MRKELVQRIEEAREHLGLRALTEEERARREQSQVMDAFKSFLAQRLEFSTRAELLIGAEDLWRETGPAIRFTIEDHVFLLARCERETLLLEEKASGSCELVCLSDDDLQFEDRLLVGIGDALQPR